MNIVTTREQLDEVVAHYLFQDAFAYDVETVGPRRGDTPVNEVLWITLATHGRCDVIPMGHPNGDLMDVVYPLTGQGEKRVANGLPARPSDYSRDVKKAARVFSEPPAQLFPAEVFSALEPLMFNDSSLIIGHNLLFDLTSVAKYYNGRVPTGPYFDTMIASFISDNRNKNKCDLASCLKREFGYEMVKGVGKEVEVYSFTDVANYAFLDARYTFLLWKSLVPKLEGPLAKVMALDMDVLAVLCDMKVTGAPIDVATLSKLHSELTADIEAAKAEVYRVAGRQFNINSNSEKQAILYGAKEDGGRGLKAALMTAGGKKKAAEDVDYSDYSVSAEALEAHRGEDDLVDAILAYADLNKLLTTYVLPYLGGDFIRTTGGKSKTEHKDSLLIDGRIHCTFNQHGTDTGRFSSTSPNLQNIPTPRTSRGKAIRNLFIAPEGYKLIVADYSQIEPRVIASMSQDPTMLTVYVDKVDGGDIYTAIGKSVGVDRNSAKTLVLSILYGVGTKKVARDINKTEKEAKALLAAFSAKYPAVGAYRNRVLAVTRTNRPPYVATIMGRRRYLPDILSSDDWLRAKAERQAFNARIQGSAADIIKLAMVRAFDMLPKGAHMILTVHDELVVLTPDTIVDEAVAALREAMEDIHVLQVPLIADIKIVQRWGEAKS